MFIRSYEFIQTVNVCITGLEEGEFTIGYDYNNKKFIAVKLRPEDKVEEKKDSPIIISTFVTDEVRFDKDDIHGGFYPVRYNGKDYIAFYNIFDRTLYFLYAYPDDVRLNDKIDLDSKNEEDDKIGHVKKCKDVLIQEIKLAIKDMNVSLNLKIENIMKIMTADDIAILADIKNSGIAYAAIIRFIRITRNIDGYSDIARVYVSVTRTAYINAAEKIAALCENNEEA